MRTRDPTPDERALWRARYQAALKRFRAAGIATVQDELGGFERYAELRSRWDSLIDTLAPKLAYTEREIDTQVSKKA